MKNVITIIGDGADEIDESIRFFIDNLPTELKEKDITKLKELMEYIERHLPEIILSKSI